MPEPHAVDQIGDAAADDEAERDGQDRVARPRPREEVEHPRHRSDGQQDHERRRACEQPEGDPGVLDVPDRKRPDDVHRLVEPELRGHDRLRQLIRTDRGERDGAQADPLRPAGAERPLRDRDRRQAVGRRTDAHVGATRRLH